MSDGLSDSVRIYLRELRMKRGISQEKVADAIGWSSRSFSDWETGKSGDIKSRFLIRLVSFLGASWEDITYLELKNTTADEVEMIIKKRTGTVPRQMENNENETSELVDQLWSNESLRRAFLVFWAGWKAREP